MSLPDEDLLSAYLDGQLSADERSRVEQLLAESPESRQLLDDLRSIQASLQRMPRARLGHEFADQVLRQAERELLTAGADGDMQEAPAEAGGEKPRVVSSSGRSETTEELSRIPWQRLRRPVIWASLTLAAGLLIMFLGPDREARRRRQVALAPGKAERADREAAQNRGDVEIGAPAVPALHDGLERAPAAAEEPESHTDDYGRGASRRAGAAPPPAAIPPMAADSPAPEAANSPAPEAADGVAGPAPGAARARSAMAGKPVQSGSGKESSIDELGTKAGEAGLGGGRLLLEADKKTLIVWCDVAEGTNYSESFQELLAEQNIRWEGAAEVAEREALLGLDLRAKTEPEDAAGKKNAPAETDLRLGDETRLKRLADAEQVVLDAASEVVLVEAGQPQIEAMLAAIDGAASVFVNVDVKPAPDAPRAQQQLRRFARGQAARARLGEDLKAAAPEANERDDAPLAKAAKRPAPEAKPSQAAGVARRLAVQPAPPPDETTKDETRKESRQQLSQSRAKREGEAQEKKPADKFAFGLTDAGQKELEDKDRFEVLFVLHPVDSSSAATPARPADAKPSTAKSADADE